MSHIFTISYNRKLSPSFVSCCDCKKVERIRQRKLAQQQEEIRSKLLEEKQEHLFKKARETQDQFNWPPVQQAPQPAAMTDHFFSQHHSFQGSRE